eukprot:CAMPEP_0114994426 /NCGR_PEP_ID=MMETSP0216-20121206/13125_1 /TAXON_ID=223996 /ORGANISM="Protocruzia adherens, Strain Boccale" /LENGTH=304 /DNA_ID=CAMNT_0002358271 /DNA_START=26 /DNA_END=937 /DNA_ORIENTATION=+
MKKTVPVEKLLGPRWVDEELGIFFNSFKEHNQQWETVVQDLRIAGFSRNSDMVRALYCKNKAYLSLPSATSQDFTIIMGDHYNSMEIDIECADETAESVMLQEEKVEKHNEELFRLVNGTTEIDAKEVTMKKPKNSPKKKYRKSYANTPDVVAMNDLGFLNQLARETSRGPSLSTTESIAPRENIRRELKNKRDRIQRGFDGSLYDPSCIYNPTYNPKQISHRVINWAKGEWFYPWIDRGFFNYNEFRNMLREAHLSEVDELSRVEWSLLRQAMGKTRRFSSKFLREEREKLYRYRDSMRLLHN